MSNEQTYLTAHKENGRWYFKEHKTKKPDLQTLLNNYKKGVSGIATETPKKMEEVVQETILNNMRS